MAKIRVERIDGFKFKASVGGFEIYADQPEKNGGSNEFINPTDMFVSAAGLCIATYAQFFARKAGIDFKRLSIDVDYEIAEAPYRIGKINIDINAPEVPEKDRKRFESFVHKCLVTVSMSNGIPVEKNFKY